MAEYENTSLQLAKKIMSAVRDFDSEEELLKEEVKILSEQIEELKATKYDNLIHYLDTIFYEERNYDIYVIPLEESTYVFVKHEEQFEMLSMSPSGVSVYHDVLDTYDMNNVVRYTDAKEDERWKPPYLLEHLLALHDTRGGATSADSLDSLLVGDDLQEWFKTDKDLKRYVEEALNTKIMLHTTITTKGGEYV